MEILISLAQYCGGTFILDDFLRDTCIEVWLCKFFLSFQVTHLLTEVTILLYCLHLPLMRCDSWLVCLFASTLCYLTTVRIAMVLLGRKYGYSLYMKQSKVYLCFNINYSDMYVNVSPRACTVTLPACCTATWWKSHQRTEWRTSSPKLLALSRSATEWIVANSISVLFFFLLYSLSLLTGTATNQQ